MSELVVEYFNLTDSHRFVFSASPPTSAVSIVEQWRSVTGQWHDYDNASTVLPINALDALLAVGAKARITLPRTDGAEVRDGATTALRAEIGQLTREGQGAGARAKEWERLATLRLNDAVEARDKLAETQRALERANATVEKLRSDVEAEKRQHHSLWVRLRREANHMLAIIDGQEPK